MRVWIVSKTECRPANQYFKIKKSFNIPRGVFSRTDDDAKHNFVNKWKVNKLHVQPCFKLSFNFAQDVHGD